MSGELDRSSASEWAFAIIDDDHIRVSDQVVWKVLQCLGGADLPITDREYLYEKKTLIAGSTKLTHMSN